ncbi:hypothetical protein [Geodermatophilus sp. Leaf369]|uniref:hypothetical protein n=1 Tax=Geodermatophilus sp. Leaf369 TaxID=1736354 RepID=UPI001F2F7DAF|nr:hypothetical protein [Geodermatophilus sp. Leaf369]
MLVLIVWVVVAVLAVLALGVLAYGLLGARNRLTRELAALERDVAPVAARLQASLAAAAQARERAGQDRDERENAR